MSLFNIFSFDHCSHRNILLTINNLLQRPSAIFTNHTLRLEPSAEGGWPKDVDIDNAMLLNMQECQYIIIWFVVSGLIHLYSCTAMIPVLKFVSAVLGICNLDHLVTCGIPYANKYGIPPNSAEFREKFTVKIPRNSVCFSKNSVFRQK
jgi:hypothetical protein